MKEIINGKTAYSSDCSGCTSYCSSWCEYNPDTNCWRDAD